MNKFRFLLGLTLVCLSSTACLLTRSEVADQEERKQSQTQVSAAEQLKADEGAKQQDLEASMRQMNGRLEAIEYRLNANLEQNQQKSETDQTTQKQLIEQMKIFDENIRRLDARLTALEGHKTGSATAVGAASATSGAKDDSPFADGEKSFQQKEWKQAILSYQAYRDQNPKGKQFADATYKIGVCFQEIGKKDEARVFFDEVIEKHPKSAAARKAQYRLKNLK